MNQRRKQLFGDSSLTAYSTTPLEGETLVGTFVADWSAKRVWETTNQVSRHQTSAWQFHIAASAAWKTDQAYMLGVVTLAIGERKFRVNKVEKPVGESLVWKVKAQEQ